MKGWKKFASDKWYMIPVLLFLAVVGIFYAVVGQNSYLAIHDDLDLFIPQYRILKETHSFFAHNTELPFLGGISRDAFPSEFSLYSFLFMLLPDYPAYIAAYLLKVVIALVSCLLLADDMAKTKGFGPGFAESLSDKGQRAILWGCSFAYGILNLFPAFGIAFASIPLVIYLFRKVYREPSPKWFVALFFYPLVSYFSYFGLFILFYATLACLILWIGCGIRKNPPAGFRGPQKKLCLSLPLVLGITVLSLGYILCEYRLFALFLLGGSETIRSSIVPGALSWSEVFNTGWYVWLYGMMHANDAHQYVVLPVVVVFFLFLNIRYIVRGKGRDIFRDPFNLGFVLLILNALCYGLYYREPVRNEISVLVPHLTGWQFNRTIFFNPFLWYGLFFLACCRVYTETRKAERETTRKLGTAGVSVAILLAVGAILLQPMEFNDLYNTAAGTAYRIVRGEYSDNLNYREFYSEELFTEIKEELGYEGEWSVAYGLYPAVLEYNGIATLDGYLGYYGQDYKERWREVIAPALDRVPESANYYDNWGARCYLYWGTDVTVDMTTKSLLGLTDSDIYINTRALSDMGCRYLFSRLEIGNAEEEGLSLAGRFSSPDSPYEIYVYTP
jgi:hypothetical protein